MIPIPPEFSRMVRVDRIPASGMALDIEAKPAERVALADRFGIPSIDMLRAELTLRVLAGGAVVRVTGRIQAQVVQTCVVTLEPVPESVDERFTLSFGREVAEEIGAEIELSLDEEDPPDPIVDGAIDVGEAVAEHLALALDPFPRKPGIVFEGGEEEAAGEAEEPEEKPNPFAVLAQLRKNKG